jgi:hypothetical protein
MIANQPSRRDALDQMPFEYRAACFALQDLAPQALTGRRA